jgi:hypothetical protein
MREPRFRAIMLVVKLMRSTGMTLIDACRVAASFEQVDYDWLYRELTEG